MQSIRQVAKIYTENMHIANEYYSNGLNVDVIKARDLVYTDRIVTKLWWYDWNLRNHYDPQQSNSNLHTEENTSNQWTKNTFTVMPENIEWCDCHLDKSFNNKCKKALQTFQNVHDNEIFTSDLMEFGSMTNGFYHYGHETTFYGGCNNLLYNDDAIDDRPQTQSFRPTKMHLKIWWHDTYEGEREMVWFYPDDLVLRIDLISWQKNTYNLIQDTSISDYDSYNFSNTYTYDQFVNEKLDNWTYDPDKPKVCDTCNGENRFNQTLELPTILKDTFMYSALYYSEMIKKTCIMAKYTRNIDLTDLIRDIAEIDEEYFEILPRLVREITTVNDDDIQKAIINNNKDVLKFLRKEFRIKTRNPIFTDKDLVDFVLHLKEQYLLSKSMRDSNNIVEYFLENWFENPVKMPLMEENGRIKNTI